MKMRLLMLYLLIFTAFWGCQTTTPILDISPLTLDRIYSSEEFRAKGFGPAKWLENGEAYTTLEPAEESTGGRDIIRYETATGARSVKVSSINLIPPGAKDALAISDYAWSPDGKCVLIFTNTKRVWRRHTRGDYWVLNLKTSALFKLGGDAEPSTLMFAKFSPDSQRVAYVIANDLYVEELKSRKITRLTTDGSRTVINGTFDWVYEEELSLRDGFRWSPDGEKIAYWQLDAEGVRDFYLINNTDDLYSRVIPVQYPKAGEMNSACRVGVVNSRGGSTQWFALEGESRNHYIARMDWAQSSDEIVIQQLNRRQNRLEVLLGHTPSGRINEILLEEDEAWVEVGNDLKWMQDGSYFTWMSERDGWRHLYLVSRSGEEVRLLTPGNFDVIGVDWIDEQGGWVYFTASPDNPTQRFLFRGPLDGSGAIQRLTPQESSGTHTYRISPDSTWAFHTHSRFTTPNVIDLVSLPDHKRIRVLQDNKALFESLETVAKGPSDFFRTEIEQGVEMDGWFMKPPGFDPLKHYPLLIHVYGEPAGQTVLDRWSRYYPWHLMLTQAGYIVVSLDNRGTPAPRGRAWRKCIYGQIGILASEDQAAAVKNLIAAWPFIDSERIGVWGWSGGGSMSLNAIFRYPDLYHTAMAIAPVGHQHYYDTIYQERYMGHPKDNEEGYTEGSPVTHAHGLKGNLLLVHGTGDDNCHYQGTEAIINELIRHNKPFTMMAYPNRGHSIYEGENTTRHLFELLTRYLHENLPAGPR